MPAGRPPKYKTADEMQKRIDEYFDRCEEQGVPTTITGLTLALGFAERCSLIDYAEKGEFSHTVKTAKLRVENAYETRLCNHGRAGDIFALKNFGWRDKTEQEVTGKDGGPVFLWGAKGD